MHPSIQIAPDFDALYPTASATATECAMNLVLTADLLVKRIATLLQPFNIMPASGLVLSTMADPETPLPPKDITDRLIVSRAIVTGLLDSLERQIYIRRLPHLSDRRMILIKITETGRKVVNDFGPIAHQHQKQWLEVLDKTEQQQFIIRLKFLALYCFIQ